MTQQDKKKKILIVDDHPIIRHGLTQLINQEAALVACGEAEDACGALQAVTERAPDLVILDISLKETNGLDLIRDIKARVPGLPVLVLSMHDETRYAERALRAGAQGYIMKQEPPDRTIEAVHRIMNGDIYLSSSMTSRMLNKIATGSPAQEASPADLLSARELEIFSLIGKGTGTRQIAQRLGLSIKTVDAHRANIKKKLDLACSTELVQAAVKWTLRREDP